ncbi:MAG TPA: methionine aminotransferase [Burkholderiaceae bacterium]|nr:methionine aminotransferase [Burkholderiaceae bacterium]HQR71279.1 methionine aminotransferase [Burkholderiaceae bacterium]
MQRIASASRLPRVGTTIFTVMSQLAVKHGAVNLGQGFPDFNCDARLQDLLHEAVRAGHNQYAPMTGVPALRAALAAKNAALYGHAYDVDAEITVTAGATQAIMASVLALVHPGDDVIVLEPTYDSYVPSIELAGGRPVHVPLDAVRGYAPDWERIRAAITPKTRLILLNFPHNPTGRVLGPDDLAALERIVEETGVLLLSDEVYEHIVFDGVPHQSLMRSPALAANTVVISSFGKTFHTTGWKVGYICAPAAMTAEIRKVHQFMVFAVNTPAQHAFAAYLADPASYLALPAFYQAKRDLLVDGLRGTPFRVLPCAGTYFVLADYSALSDQPEPEFAQTMITRFGVAVIPVSVFYDTPTDRRVVRFCFAKKDETLRAALDRIKAAL